MIQGSGVLIYRGVCHVLRALLCYGVLFPTSLVYADLAEELLGVEEVKPPVRRAIDQVEDNKDAKKASQADRLPGVPDAIFSDDELLDLIQLLLIINKQLGQLVVSTDTLASQPASVGAASGSAVFNSSNHYGKIAVPWGEKKQHPKETMLHLLKTINSNLANLFAELGVPEEAEVLKKLKLQIARAQQAVINGVPDPKVKKKKKLKPGWALESVHGGANAAEHFRKKTHSVVVDRLHQPRVRIPGTPSEGVTPAIPTEAIKDLDTNPVGDLHPRVDLSKIDNVTVNTKNLVNAPSISTPSMDNITEHVNQEVGKVGPISPNVPDASSLTPDIDTDDIEKKANVSQKIGQVSANVNKDVGDVTENINSIDEHIKENIGKHIADISKDVDGISKNVNEDVSGIKEDVDQKVDDIKEQVNESVDESGLKQKIENQIASRVNPDLEKVRKLVVKSTNQAYAGVTKYLNNQISTQRTAILKKFGREWWLGLGYDDAKDWWGGEPAKWPDWVDDRNKDVKTYKKYYNGRAKVLNDQQVSISSINTLFANTESLLASGQGGPVPAGEAGGADDSADPPRYQQELTPQSGDDHRRIELNGSFNETIIAPAEVVASIGDRSFALGEFGTVGAEADTAVGTVRQTVTTPGVISAAIGYEADALLRVGTIDSMIRGDLNRTVTAPGLIVGAIGGKSAALSSIGVIAGDVSGNVSQKIVVPASVVASLGADTTAEFYVGAVQKDASVGGLKQDITLYSPTINAAIGYKSKALTTIGNITKDVSGTVDQTIRVGGIVNASIGAHTEGIISIGDINATVGGHVKQHIVVDDVLSATVGAGTKNEITVGSINAPVTGSVDMNISTGSLNAISVGAHTYTRAVIGSIQAPVHGNVNSNIHTGSITNFAIGIGVGSGTSISAQTFVGSVFQPVQGNVNIDISTGHIFTFGFGLDIDLGPLGELRIVIDGCKGSGTTVGNIGGPC